MKKRISRKRTQLGTNTIPCDFPFYHNPLYPSNPVGECDSKFGSKVQILDDGIKLVPNHAYSKREWTRICHLIDILCRPVVILRNTRNNDNQIQQSEVQEKLAVQKKRSLFRNICIGSLLLLRETLIKMFRIDFSWVQNSWVILDRLVDNSSDCSSINQSNPHVSFIQSLLF